MGKAVFLTGGTGFLGTEIVSALLRETDRPIYALVRAQDNSGALHRLKAVWFDKKDIYAQLGSRIIPVAGDFTKLDLGIAAGDRQQLVQQIAVVIHAGAEVGFQKDEQELMRTNRDGTAHVLTFAKEIPHLTRFVHVSTAYVAGQRRGTVPEDASVGDAFSSLYEKSKAEAEALVRASGMPFVICRPGMIVGHAQTGWTSSFNTIYYVLRLLLLKKLRILPVSRNTGLNILPVDYVADTVVKIAFSETAGGKTFHITCPGARQPKIGEVVDYVRTWAKQNLNTDLPRMAYVPLPMLKKLGLQHNRKTTGRQKSFVSNLLTLLPYFFNEQQFDRSNTDAVTGLCTLDWHDYINPLLSFACRKNFMRQTGQTVFEQAFVRRASTRHPMKFYDVAANGITEVPGEEVNRRVQKIVDALWAWGIRKGDRVAMTGINSVDYMALDQAIGTIGAVSVPLYYTTPIDEANLLLERSGAKWFFVGDQRIMKNIGALNVPVQVVAFSSGLPVSKPSVMRWDTFLQKAAVQAPVQAPDPDDLATIRYTSGTTGEPKGVMFSFRQLAWMGEVLTNLLTWQDRNKVMRYMSFLPESHVVEGILASYAPYYMLARVDFYFLNDFSSLADLLPKVRPTVFFSVPRFYEKLWSQMTANKFGQKYLQLEDGFAKRVMASLLRKIALKKAGLDACKQLIVGSAPISETLLRNLQALGIEVHNAYGQTEAPLITINRLGDNIIPTIGTPLPETEITTLPDGELIVKGPQVALGYYGLETETIRDGILKTGDLGVIHENGHITLFGRKKEMIITAYGKNISIPKIEEQLKNIPCVSEAVLIGENRPYCTALLWTEGACSDLDAQIAQMNAKLSHPEQIRRYTVIEKPLSVQAGELTPNLKVKRANVEAHYRQEIEEMYR